jgi:hypothetical protein
VLGHPSGTPFAGTSPLKIRKGPHQGPHRYEATDRLGAQNPLIPDRPVAVLPADFGEARRVDRACVSQETKAQEVKAEKISVPPASLAYGKIIVDQSDKIQGSSDKKKKPGKPDHTEAGGKISHFRLRFFGSLRWCGRRAQLAGFDDYLRQLALKVLLHSGHIFGAEGIRVAAICIENDLSIFRACLE